MLDPSLVLQVLDKYEAAWKEKGKGILGKGWCSVIKELLQAKKGLEILAKVAKSPVPPLSLVCLY